MNEASGVCMSKKDLNRIFSLIDRNKNGKIRLEEIKTIIQLTMLPDEDKDDTADGNSDETDTANLKGEALMFRLKVNDLYEELKNRIETKNVTVE
jgi:Ca2+-binding EF-hand superfamily protein